MSSETTRNWNFETGRIYRFLGPITLQRLSNATTIFNFVSFEVLALTLDHRIFNRATRICGWDVSGMGDKVYQVNVCACGCVSPCSCM